MARKSFTLNKSTLGARAIFLLIKGSRAAVNAQDDSAPNFSQLLSLGERVSGCGVLTSRDGTGEGSVGSSRRDTNHAANVRSEGTNPECL
jgi:hypothetical protein